jgi:hypothetical protein
MAIFGRINDAGNVAVFHAESGEPVTQLDAAVYPVGSNLSARYEHPRGIVLSRSDAARIGVEVED